MKQRVLVTGISGFAGGHLAEYAAGLPDVELYGMVRWRSQTRHLRHLDKRLTLIEGDVRDQSSVLRVMQSVKPHRIFHLAAQSYVPTSWNAPEESLTTNVLGTLHLLEAARQVGGDPLIHIACSSEEYGLVYPEELPIREGQPFRPQSPYAVSKVTQDLLGYQYFWSYGLRIIRTRAFNHTGPRQREVFAVSNFARQIVEREQGLQGGALRVGDLQAVRDFMDVGDAVRGYWLALERGEPGEVYNIASGKGYPMEDILAQLMATGKVQLDLEVDTSRLRPSDVPRLVGDVSKFKARTGWAPEIPFENTLANLLEYWRGQLAVTGKGHETTKRAVANPPISKSI